MNEKSKPAAMPTGNIHKAPPKSPASLKKGAPMARPGSAVRPIREELTRLRAAAAAIQHIRISAQQELDMARKMRAEAVKYQMETETRARSQAQQLILSTRLATQKEIEELISRASAEIQKILADIRALRITAQEELATQHKYTDAAKILSMSASFGETFEDIEGNRRAQLVFKQ